MAIFSSKNVKRRGWAISMKRINKMQVRNYFAAMMVVETGDADCVISGLTA